MKAKAVSPMIAVVLLIAFTVAVGGILSLWLSGLSGTTTATAGSATEKSVLCASSLQITDVNSTFGGDGAAGDVFNVTVRYVAGSENLYFFNLTFVDNLRTSATVTPPIGSNFNKSAPFTSGRVHTFNIALNSTTYVLVATNLPGTVLEKVTVTAKCQDTIPIIATCNRGDVCMKTSTA